MDGRLSAKLQRKYSYSFKAKTSDGSTQAAPIQPFRSLNPKLLPGKLKTQYACSEPTSRATVDDDGNVIQFQERQDKNGMLETLTTLRWLVVG
jgi:hypothetical protein